MNGCRLQEGGKIDRSSEIRFTFNGRQYRGYEGDTLASALLANGVTPTSRSFKYHRPRGIMSCGIEEPGTYIEMSGANTGANQSVTSVRLASGLDARSVHGWPSARFDLLSVLQVAAPLIPAGFYYKTFFWPSWKFYEPLIRAAAGLAAAPMEVPSGSNLLPVNWHCDVLVVGSGPAGLAAALTASESGKRVTLVEMEEAFGGSLMWDRCLIGNQDSDDWASQALATLRSRDNVTLLNSTFAWACREHNMVIASQRSCRQDGACTRTWRIRADRMILATGATERMLVFPNNDRPGVMLAGSIRRYLSQYAVRPGRRAVLFGNNDTIYDVVPSLQQAGVDVIAIVDTRRNIPSHVADLAGNIRIYEGHEIVDVHGRMRVSSIEVAPVSSGRNVRLSCDLLGISGGWDPNLQLLGQAREELQYCDTICALRPASDGGPVSCTGAAAGDFSLPSLMKNSWAAGYMATGIQGQTPSPECSGEAWTIEPYWHSGDNIRPAKSFVDILNDVTLLDIQLAHRENYSHVEQVKRYTTAGMGLNQGRTASMNVIGALATSTNVPVAEIGRTTFRSPVAGVEFGSIGPAGLRISRPFRTTPITNWHVRKGAEMYEAGANWRRPGYYPRAGESMQDTINREALATRNGVGVYDGSPLGKFELKGSGATRFLNLVYTSRIDNLRAGMGRYGLMLTEAGLILDDGVCFRLGENRYLISTSTANATRVHHHLTKLLAFDCAHLDVRVTDLTHQWTNATICGPKARDLLSQFDIDIDISPDALPFMAIADCTVEGRRCKIARVSFTGELSFELNVRPRDLPWLWDEIMARGERYGIEPVGSETSHVLRVEKGFLSLGHEADGTADPHDLQMGWVISKQKRDFIGKRAITLRRHGTTNRRELVGLHGEDPQFQLPEGAPITRSSPVTPTIGFVTASVWSVVNERWVALALLENGSNRHGETINVNILGNIVKAEVTRPVFHDPEGKRLRS